MAGRGLPGTRLEVLFCKSVYRSFHLEPVTFKLRGHLCQGHEQNVICA